MSEQDPLHPESLRTLRELVRLHGAAQLIAAINDIEAIEQKKTAEALDSIAKSWLAVFGPNRELDARALDEIAKSWLEHARHFPINEALYPDTDQP